MKQIALILIFLLCERFAFASDCDSALRDQAQQGSLWSTAMSKIPELQKFTEQLTSEDKSYFLPMVEAALAAVTKHHTVISQNQTKKMDFARHGLILKQIADFDSRKPRLSLYRIKRAIEGRHSLSEYIRCH